MCLAFSTADVVVAGLGYMNRVQNLPCVRWQLVSDCWNNPIAGHSQDGDISEKMY